MASEENVPFDPTSFEHIPVLLNECLEGLAIDPAGTYLDGTAGGAGHSRQIALRLNGEQGGRLISLDQDPDAVQTARARLAGLPATVVQINFRYAGQALESLGIDKVNGALLDLGVSSHQLDDAERGFSYHADAPLDMRMSREGMTAADILNTYDVDAMARIFREFGEERFAYPIAKRIAAQREKEPFTHTGQLVELIYATIPAAARREGGHPAKRVFQALRIAVNHELDALEEGLEDFAGCAVVISHDRWFLDRICTHILAFEGDSQVFYFEGSYTEYEENKMKRMGNVEPKRVRYRKLMED